MPITKKREEAQFLGTLLVDNRRVLHDTIDGEVLAVCSDTGTYYSLRGIAAEIWSLLAMESSQDDIINELTQRYADPEGRISSDTTNFIEQLLSEGLLTRLGPEAGGLGDTAGHSSSNGNENFDTNGIRQAAKDSMDALADHCSSPQDGTLTDHRTEAASPPVEPSRPWLMPALEIYSDMQDLLLFDPIHEVDPACGWPSISGHAR